jgi:uncharacterized integral membrane protein (TIGR00698 family)
VDFVAIRATSTAGVPDTRDAESPSHSSVRGSIWHRLPGLCEAVTLAAVASVLGHFAPVIGASVFAVVGGIAVGRFRPRPETSSTGITFASKWVLQGSIVVLGTGLSFHQVLTIGSSSLPVLLGTVGVALLGAGLLGRLLSIDRNLRTLIGVGTGICGASAIAATDAVIDASEADVSYAIATIFTFNVIAVLTFPTLGRLFELSPHSFGLWAGTAVNDMSSVVAASSIFGKGATSYAVVVKLTRTLMIVPISFALAFWCSRRARREGQLPRDTPLLSRLRHVMPFFIVWFLVAVTANTIGLVPLGWHGDLLQVAQTMITIALAAIGLSTRLQDIRRAGLRPLLLGAMLWALVGCTSIAIQLGTGGLRG